MKYSTKDLAEILGCTTSAILYFEKEKLIQVEKEENGHRYYKVVDVFRLLSYMKYRAMEMPMKTIISQFGGKENNRSLIQEREEFYKEEALKKAQYYTDLAGAIEEHLVGVRKIDALQNHYEFAQSPEMLVMCDEECGWLSKNRSSQHLIHEWVKAMPMVQLSILDKGMELSDFGYLIDPKKQRKLGLPLDLYTKILPSTSCLHTIVKAEENFAEQPQNIFCQIKEYARAKGLEVGAMAWGKILLVEVEEGAKLHPYVELWVLIKI